MEKSGFMKKIPPGWPTIIYSYANITKYCIKDMIPYRNCPNNVKK